MLPLLAALIPLVGVALVVGLLLWRGRARVEANQGAWRKLADDLYLTWSEDPEDPGIGKVNGTLEGLTVSVFRERLQSAAHPSRRWPVTRVRTELGLDLGVGMGTASRKVGGGWAMKAGLLPKVAVGDPVFDLSLMAHAQDPAGALRWLGPDSRAALMAAATADLPSFYLDDTGVLTEFQGLETDLPRLRATVRAQVALVKALRASWGQ